MGYRILEVPIVFPDRQEGESKMTPDIALEALWRVWKIRFKGV
jgi:dolichol-phosphate mannosyltransferase